MFLVRIQPECSISSEAASLEEAAMPEEKCRPSRVALWILAALLSVWLRRYLHWLGFYVLGASPMKFRCRGFSVV